MLCHSWTVHSFFQNDPSNPLFTAPQFQRQMKRKAFFTKTLSCDIDELRHFDTDRQRKSSHHWLTVSDSDWLFSGPSIKGVQWCLMSSLLYLYYCLSVCSAVRESCAFVFVLPYLDLNVFSMEFTLISPTVTSEHYRLKYIANHGKCTGFQSNGKQLLHPHLRHIKSMTSLTCKPNKDFVLSDSLSSVDTRLTHFCHLYTPKSPNCVVYGCHVVTASKSFSKYWFTVCHFDKTQPYVSISYTP